MKTKTLTIACVIIASTSIAYRDTETGTFLTRDPIGFADGPNQYCYVHGNPITGYDPTGLWGVMRGYGGPVHQYITKQAIKDSGVKMNWWSRRDMIDESAKEADLTLAHFSKENTYQHSTSLGGWSAKETKDKMMEQAKEWYTKGGDDGFGKLLHMTQDSFCPGHTERNENGAITAFLNYYAQTQKKGGKELHTSFDTLKDENGNIRPEIQLAIDASSKLIQMQADGASWEDIAKYLNDEVFVMTDDAKVYEGKDFEKLPDASESEDD